MIRLKNLLVLLLLATLFPAAAALADAGILIPISEKEEPDPAILSMDRMIVNIVVDNQYAAVDVLQVYSNHTKRILEGKYIFQIPGDSSISSFAVWDGSTRIPGVILEKQRAAEMYKSIRDRAIDPGLLQQSDRIENRNDFQARIVPIPAYGTKRLELRYNQRIDVDSLRSFFSFPLKPTLFRKQKTDYIEINLLVKSDSPIGEFIQRSETMPLEFTRKESHAIEAQFRAHDFSFTENFDFELLLDVQGIGIDVQTYRKTDISDEPVPLFIKEVRRKDMDGYFLANIIFNTGGAIVPFEETGSHDPVSAVVMLDTSLSMRWEKLEKSYEAIHYFLSRLTPEDSFSVSLFNDSVETAAPMLPATDKNISSSISFIRKSHLNGGTDIEEALRRGIEIASGAPGNAPPCVIAVTDGNPTFDTIDYKKIAASVAEHNTKDIPLYIFGIGNDTNTILLEELVEPSDGYFDWALETADLDFKLKSFFSKIGEGIIRDISFDLPPSIDAHMVYPSGPQRAFNGTSVSYTGRYSSPADSARVSIKGRIADDVISESASFAFPAEAHEDGHIKRIWARARVDHLLRLIEFEGERREWIDEVIELAKQYTFITPYTSFLAAPRSLLRPRVIRPGDPVLRVHTDESIVSVTAIFPFNLTKSLHYVSEKDAWETRFLAPVWMNDGRYECALILRDRQGNTYREKKYFIIDSRPPGLEAELDRKYYRPGDTVNITVRADRDTRRIRAFVSHLPPAPVEWDPGALACTGRIALPPDMPGGRHSLKIVARDFAHNISSTEIQLEVLQ